LENEYFNIYKNNNFGKEILDLFDNNYDFFEIYDAYSFFDDEDNNSIDFDIENYNTFEEDGFTYYGFQDLENDYSSIFDNNFIENNDYFYLENEHIDLHNYDTFESYDNTNFKNNLFIDSNLSTDASTDLYLS